jgi:hypothetical protein
MRYKHSGIGGKIAITVTARAAPNRFRFADHRNLLFVKTNQRHAADAMRTSGDWSQGCECSGMAASGK